jgi:hypothetical protein
MSDRSRRRVLASLKTLPLVVLCALLNAAQVAAEPVCRPTLTVKEESFSEIFNLRRVWTASINVDASQCRTASGLFSMRFIRLAENAPDLTFTESFTWRSGQKSVAVEFWANEAVHKYWIDEVAACPCRRD